MPKKFFQVTNGHIKRMTDEDVRVLVLEMRGTNVATCYIFTPICPKEVLGIRLPFLVMIVKNLKKYFSFEITVSCVHRRVRGACNLNFLRDRSWTIAT